MAYGSVLTDVVQSSTAGTAPTFKDGNGTETGTLCRAWVNFNGTGTVAIRASFNVSSITDNGTGDYTVNFTTAMPDANYSVVGSAGSTTTSADNQFFVWQKDTGSRTASSVRLVSTQHGTASSWGPNPADTAQFNVSIFR